MEARNFPLKYALHQIIAACIAHSIAIQAGINMAYSTILLPEIMLIHNGTEFLNETHKLVVNQEEGSWITSLVTITTPIGSLITGPLMDHFGRKKICAFTAMPFALSWTLIVLTTNSVYTIYSARILAGIGGGLSTAALVYVSEISHPAIRPMLLSLTSVFVSLGILITTVLGNFLTWRTVAICCGLMAATSFTLMMFIPESPSWLVGVRSNKRDKAPNTGLRRAEISLKWLYKRREDYQLELDNLRKIQDQQRSLKKEKLFEKLDDRPDYKRKPKIWKPLLILFFLFFFQQLSGGYIIIFYAVQIFEKVASVDLDKFTSFVILGVIRFLMAVISVYLSRNIGRRPLLISSGIGMTVSILSSALYLYFFETGITAVVCVLLFVFFSSYGVLVIPWSLIGELLPLHARGKGSGLMIALAYVLMFVTVKIFMLVLDEIGIVSIFVVFGIVSFLTVIYVYFAVPETLGKTFEEIEDSL